MGAKKINAVLPPSSQCVGDKGVAVNEKPLVIIAPGTLAPFVPHIMASLVHDATALSSSKHLLEGLSTLKGLFERVESLKEVFFLHLAAAAECAAAAREVKCLELA